MNSLLQLAGAYLRVSTDEQAEHGISLPDQKKRLAAYIQAQGWELYDFYIDDGYSGKDLDRPAMRKLIVDAQNKKINYIVVIKLDRLSRRQKDVLFLIEDIFDANGVGFKSVNESFDTTTPYGKAGLGMMAVFAQLERETIVERVLAAKKEAARQGRWLGGGVPYGYNYDELKKVLVANENTADTVELIYSLYETGKYGMRSLAEAIAERNIPSPLGKIWYKDTIKKILTNPTYAGYIHRRGELNEGHHQSIIDRERWHRVQEIIKNKYIPRPPKDANNLLAGLIYCGKCGARMRFKTQNWKDPKSKSNLKRWTRQYYICYSRAKYDHMVKDPNCDMPFIPVDKANTAVAAYLTELSLSPTLLKSVVNNAMKKGENDDIEKELKAVTKEIAGLKKKIERWNTAFENGAIEIEDLMQRTKDLREKRKSLEERESILTIQIEESEQNFYTSKELIEQIKNFNEIWENATPDERRVLFTLFVDKVIVHDTENYEVILNL